MISFLIVPAALSLLAGCMGAQSFAEARRELASLIDPAVQGVFGDFEKKPDRVEDSDQCSDPFFGPSQGRRPYLVYRMSTADLAEDPKELVLKAESIWRSEGLEISADETDTLFSRTATRESYALHAYANFSNNEVTISGTGPCVEDPTIK